MDDIPPEVAKLWREAEDHINHYRFDRAVEIYRYVLIRYGDNNSTAEYAHACLGNILITRGRIDQGENHIRKALSYDPENHSYHYLLGVIYYLRHEWENAVHEYKLALDRQPWNREYLHALGEATFNSGDKKTGLEYLNEAIPLYPHNSGLLAELATAYMSIGDTTSAEQYAETAVQTNPGDVMAHAVLRRIKQEMEEPPH